LTSCARRCILISEPKISEAKFSGDGEARLLWATRTRPCTRRQFIASFKETIHRFLQLHRYLRDYSRRARAEGISGRKIAALRYLLEAGPRTIGQLSDYHYISDSSTSEMVAQLERLGYVTRTRSQEDQRVVLVDLTEAGRNFAQNIPLGGIPLLRERLKALPPGRLSVIHEALTDLVRLLGVGDDR